MIAWENAAMSPVMEISQSVADMVKSARRIAVLTGAGVSAESGVPTFRGKDGLWNNYRAEELATPEAFGRDPALVWRWYDWRRTLIAPLTPNPGHYALAEFETIFPKFTLITQNVDGLHAKAGSRAPIELHGNIWKTRCVYEGTIFDNHETPLKKIPPRCQNCGALIRPHIVWFGESLEEDVLGAAIEAAENCDMFFVIGTSAVVQPAASLAHVARRNGAKVMEINMEETSITPFADVTLLGPSGKVLPELLGMVKNGRQ